MSSHYQVLETTVLKRKAPLCQPLAPADLSVNSPAIEAFEDFSLISPLLVPEDIDYVHLRELFLGTHRHFSLVEDKTGKLTGILFLEDVVGPRSMIKAYECQNSLREQTAGELMIPLGSLPGISLARARKASVGDIISTLKRLSVTSLLVTDDDGETVCGIFSLKNINSLLPLRLPSPLHAGSVAEIAQVINGHYQRV